MKCKIEVQSQMRLRCAHDRRGLPGQAQLHTHKLTLPVSVMKAATPLIYAV